VISVRKGYQILHSRPLRRFALALQDLYLASRFRSSTDSSFRKAEQVASLTSMANSNVVALPQIVTLRNRSGRVFLICLHVSRAEGLDSMDFSTGLACASHASDVLGMWVMITSALLWTETERWREEQRLSSSGVFIGGFLGRLGMTLQIKQGS
jgi:hypothetical protein